MNKRLQELVEQADSTIYDQLDSNALDPFVEKFAELIVRECANCVTTGTYDATPPYDKVIPVLLNELASGMKRHFAIDK